jgi:hypothetical protein
MSQTVPLGAALCVEGDDVIVSVKINVVAFARFFEIFDSMLKGFTSANAVIKIVQAQVQLDRDTGLDFLCSIANDIGCQIIQCCAGVSVAPLD